MSIFADYADFYDLLYQNKDYVSETLYVRNLILENDPDADSLLDVGTGTGAHAIQFARHGYRVHGIDISRNMIRLAQAKLPDLEPCMRQRLHFSQANLQKLELGVRYGAVLALFHVMSYQTSDDALEISIKAAKRHCRTGGLFIFDFWYGPAVLHQGVAHRVRTFENDEYHVVRIAEPEHHNLQNCVNVNYRLLVLEKQSGSQKEIIEKHCMRYLFLPDLDDLLKRSGFVITGVYEWMRRVPPSENSWSACIVARAVQ